MILNHYQAVKYLVDNVNYPPTDGNQAINGGDLRTLHAILSDNLLENPDDAGKIRCKHVNIQYSSYRPLGIAESIQYCFQEIITKASGIQNPFEQAFFLSVHLPYLQPFIDCNKRTARMACNIPLLKSGLIPMTWMDVEPSDLNNALLSVYELNDTSLLEELFVEGYLRSIERFQIMRNESEPDELRLRYGTQIKEAVRNRILNNDDSVPSSVDPMDENLFEAHVEKELERITQIAESEEMQHILPMYRLRRGDVLDWMASSRRRQRERSG